MATTKDPDGGTQPPNAQEVTQALMAVSTTATADDSLHNTIFHCVVMAFDEEGLHHISSEAAKIVWIDIPDDVIVKLGDDVTDCLAGNGIQVPELATAFDALKTSNQVTVVGDLVSVIAQLAGS
jgi:hypothetical protein